MTRAALLLALAIGGCSATCQKQAAAFWTGEYRCGDMVPYIYTAEPRTRIVCDGVDIIDVTCAVLRVEWNEPDERPYWVEVWCGDELRGRATAETIMGE